MHVSRFSRSSHLWAVAVPLLAAPVGLAQPCLEWSQVPGLPVLTSPADMAFAGNGEVLVIGKNSAGVMATWGWNGSGWHLRATGGPSPRTGHTVAYDTDRGQLVLFGGNISPGYSAETWIWDGANWTLQLADGPSG